MMALQASSHCAFMYINDMRTDSIQLCWLTPLHGGFIEDESRQKYRGMANVYWSGRGRPGSA